MLSREITAARGTATRRQVRRGATYIHSQQFWPDYDGPEDTYLVREKRVVKNLRDIDLDGLGPDEDT
jgi:hypothetical protein